ncbi:MAG: hypothetical protein J5756_03635 [Clostridia bacterium]|nr:hypothetical protein [Clostridia bacterium]
MKKQRRVISLILTAAMLLCCPLLLCACTREVPPERVPYLPAEKTFALEGPDIKASYVATYEWNEDNCVVYLSDPAADITNLGTLTFKKVDETTFALTHSLYGKGADVVNYSYGFIFDESGRLKLVGSGASGGAEFEYDDDNTINVVSGGSRYENNNCRVVLDRENKLATLTRDENGETFVMQYDHDGNVWPKHEGVEREYVNGGDLKKLVIDGVGITDTEFSSNVFTERWQRLADKIIDLRMFVFCSLERWYDRGVHDAFVAAAVTALVI